MRKKSLASLRMRAGCTRRQDAVNQKRPVGGAAEPQQCHDLGQQKLRCQSDSQDKSGQCRINLSLGGGLPREAGRLTCQVNTVEIISLKLYPRVSCASFNKPEL
jgi:hypothetical protein